VIHVALRLLLPTVVVLMYHEGMTVPRQGKSSETGRVNQKRRTRAAIVESAKELLQQGTTPTVAQAAEAALVSRTTAYRYFPTQE
jgi:AcrR family transcriptional regulator